MFITGIILLITSGLSGMVFVADQDKLQSWKAVPGQKELVPDIGPPAVVKDWQRAYPQWQPVGKGDTQEALDAMAFFLAEAALGDSLQDTSSDGTQSNGHSNNKFGEDSPLIGGGVRTPPDIGASGTASSTPPVRSESPTDEPHILPDVSPVPRHPSIPEKAPVKESEPLGQPDQFQKTPEK